MAISEGRVSSKVLLPFIALTAGVVAGAVMAAIFWSAELRDRRVRAQQEQYHRDQDKDDHTFWELVNSNNWVD